MNKFMLTAISAFSISVLILLVFSCEKPFDRDENVFTKTGIPMTGGQAVPANSSAATGTLDVIYVRGEHTLSYTINWSGLSGPPVAGLTSFICPGSTPDTARFPGIGVYGPSDPGKVAPTCSPFASFKYGVAQSITGYPNATSGTYKGSLFVDGVAVKEADLLNNQFYIQIRTAAYPNGQLRGQVDFR